MVMATIDEKGWRKVRARSVYRLVTRPDGHHRWWWVRAGKNLFLRDPRGQLWEFKMKRGMYVRKKEKTESE